MHRLLSVLLALVCFGALAPAQTAEELVAKNIQAKGGLEKIKALNTLRSTGKLQAGSFKADILWEQRRPEMLRQSFTIQGMTSVQAYDGDIGWQIQPFYGRKDPEMLGEDDLRTIQEDADFDGPLVDYQQKGNTIEYLGKDTIDGDDVYRLKVTLKNGDIVYYYLDPDTFLEIRTERQQFIRGNVRETVTDIGSYKPVNGVMFPFSLESGTKSSHERQKVTLDKIEANVPIPDSDFRMPGAPAVAPQPKK